MSKRDRKTTTIQVTRPLDVAITNFAAKQGITKAEAADRIFSILYPDGKIPEGTPPIAPRDAEETQETEETAVSEEPIGEDVSDELGKTVKDLRTVHTIKALQKGLEDKEEEEEWSLTPKEAFEMKKIEKMFGSESSSKGSQVDIAALLENQRKEMMAYFDKVMAESKAASHKEEADFYKRKLEEKEAAETRAQEIAQAMAPTQEAVVALNQKLETLAKELKPESKEAPTSAELTAIRDLGNSIKEGIAELAKRGAGGTTSEQEKLTNYIDDLTTLIDKINAFVKKGEAAGELDWRVTGISTFGEVASEAIKAFGEIEKTKSAEEKPSAEQPPVSTQIIERRVYNYAMKKIAAGELTINPYAAAEELGLTPNQVWAAVESLRKRGALKTPPTEKGEHGEKPGAETPTSEAFPGVEG